MKFKIWDKVKIIKNAGLEIHNIHIWKSLIIKEINIWLDYPYVLDTETLIFAFLLLVSI